MNYFIKQKCYRLALIASIISMGHVSPILAKGVSSDYTCVDKPLINPPPSLTLTTPVKPESIKALCPEGQVPQPYAMKDNQQKGLPPVGNTLAPSLNHALNFRYVYTYRYANNIGSTVYFSQHKPYLSAGDYHSLAELAVMSTDNAQIAEIGWTVDRGLNGDDYPHIFVFTWVNRQPNCYNGCGYIQYSPTVRPGMRVKDDGSQHAYTMMYYAGNWWLNYDGEWMGYFPETIWSSRGISFKQSGFIQWFGEVALNTGSMTQMGNGQFGSTANAAIITNASLLMANGGSIPAGFVAGATHPSCYNFGPVTQGNTVRYGGPGCNS